MSFAFGSTLTLVWLSEPYSFRLHPHLQFFQPFRFPMTTHLLLMLVVARPPRYNSVNNLNVIPTIV